jgi:hypothetical protein
MSPYPTMTQLTLTEEQERELLWGDISHLYKSCGGGCDGDWDSEDMKADPAWREMSRLLRVATCRNWTKPTL